MEPATTLILAASSALDGAAVGAVLFRAGRLDAPRAALAVAAGALAFLVKLPFLVGLSGSFFYGVALAYADVMVVAPLVGLATLVAARRRAVTAPVRALALASLGLVPVGVYATFVEPFRLVEERVEVPVPADRLAAPLRVAVLADVQSAAVTDRLRDAVARAMAFEPHLVLLPGDLIQVRTADAYRRVAPDFTALLEPLDAPLGVWFVMGNTDWPPQHLFEVLEDAGVGLLDDEAVELEHAGGRVLLGGAGLSSRDGRTRAFVRDFERRPDGGLRLLVAHYPDVLDLLAPDTRVDLLVAGHTHGGQVQVPFFGPLITLSRVPRRVAAGGLHDVDGRRVYVSRGLGWEGGDAPRVRFLAPPEVSLLTLVPQ